MGRDIDERLADLDRRLRAVQEELLPDHEPRPAAPPPRLDPPLPPRQGLMPPPPPSAAPITELHAKLLGSFRELLGAYEWLLTQTAQAPGPPRPPPPSPAPASGPAGISAGPFPSTDAVRAFEANLAALPGVRTVSLRGYEGADRAVFDVEVGEP